ncbi:MAG: hypothetical protein QOH43_2368, partial [Solirubrobacteraceae bacterium]|nr:hypothetical protein [Solirubrobacteraceae bacterium]
PLAAIARETGDYLRRHLVLEPWGTTLPTGPLEDPDAEPPDPDEERPRRLASRR